MYFRKCTYCNETYDEIIDINKPQYEAFNEDLFKDKYKEGLEAYNHANLQMEIEAIIEGIPDIVKENISGIYSKGLYENLYISALMTIISRISLPNDKMASLSRKSSSYYSKSNDVKYYYKNMSTDLVSWHLPEDSIPVLAIIVNRSYNSIVDAINEAIHNNKIEDDEYTDILTSGFFGDINDD